MFEVRYVNYAPEITLFFAFLKRSQIHTAIETGTFAGGTTVVPFLPARTKSNPK